MSFFEKIGGCFLQRKDSTGPYQQFDGVQQQQLDPSQQDYQEPNSSGANNNTNFTFFKSNNNNNNIAQYKEAKQSILNQRKTSLLSLIDKIQEGIMKLKDGSLQQQNLINKIKENLMETDSSNFIDFGNHNNKNHQLQYHENRLKERKRILKLLEEKRFQCEQYLEELETSEALNGAEEIIEKNEKDSNLLINFEEENQQSEQLMSKINPEKVVKFVKNLANNDDDNDNDDQINREEIKLHEEIEQLLKDANSLSIE